MERMSEHEVTNQTVRGHGYQTGDTFRFYGGNWTKELSVPVVVKLGKEGVKYTLTDVYTGEIVMTMGSTAKFLSDSVTDNEGCWERVTARTLDNGDTVWTGECVHGWMTGFHVSQDDATAVVRAHGKASRPLYVAPAEVPAEPAPFSAKWGSAETVGKVWTSSGRLIDPDHGMVTATADTAPAEVPAWVDNTCPMGGQHEPSFRHVISSHNGLTTGTCKCGRKVRSLDFHVRDYVTEAEMIAIGAGNHCSNGRCADCDACKLAFARFLASDPFGARVTVGGVDNAGTPDFPVAAVVAFTPSDDLSDDAEFLAQVAHENGNRVSRDHAAVAVKVKTPVRTLLNKRRRKATKVNRRKVKGGF